MLGLAYIGASLWMLASIIAYGFRAEHGFLLAFMVLGAALVVTRRRVL